MLRENNDADPPVLFMHMCTSIGHNNPLLSLQKGDLEQNAHCLIYKSCMSIAKLVLFCRQNDENVITIMLKMTFLW